MIGFATAQETDQPTAPFGGEDCDHGGGPSLLIEPRAHLRTVVGDTDLEDAGLAHGEHEIDRSLDVSGFTIEVATPGVEHPVETLEF